MNKPLLVAIDLELNQPSGSIIQIGAVIGNVATGEVLGHFDTKVNASEILSEFIIDLTGIKQEMVDAAPNLQQAYEQLKTWLQPYGNDRILNPLTWGGGDADELRQALGLDRETWIFGRRWIDAKTLFIAWRMSRGEALQGGLARAMTNLGLRFEGRKHNAHDDALNTFRIYRALLEQFK